MRLPFLALSCSALAACLIAPASAQALGQGGGAPVLCGSPDFAAKRSQFLFQPPSDCAYASNMAGAAYDPGFTMEIPVVWHVLSRPNGTGDISDAVIQQQMQLMNDDFRPPAGAQGTDAGIQFVLASEDPQGNPTTGIERITNNQWFQDQGSYTQLTWDSERYLNIYTMEPFGGGGVIGYVTDLPQSGSLVGSDDDAVRMLWSAISSSNFNHVLSHEVGHYLGLYHTWGTTGACANMDCQTQGDLICDTNPHQGPTNSCSGNPSSCGGQQVPRNNYMNYQDVACVWEFTLGQIQRMRCSLQNWRPDVWSAAELGNRYCMANPNTTGQIGVLQASGSATAGVNDLTLSASQLPLNQFGIFLNGTLAASISNPGGSQGVLCIGGALGRYTGPGQLQTSGSTGSFSLAVDLTDTPTPTGPTSILSGQTWYFQAWYRDWITGQGATSNFTDALEIAFQ